MFKDYYLILEIPSNATFKEIKDAFKKQAIKWHPDKNKDINTTLQMQDINEAYLFLKDVEGREKYDLEYNFYKSHYKKDEDGIDEIVTEYQVRDEVLNKWMQNARKQAIDLAKETIKEVRVLSVIGTRTAANEIWKQLVFKIIVGIIIMILFIIPKTCFK